MKVDRLHEYFQIFSYFIWQNFKNPQLSHRNTTPSSHPHTNPYNCATSSCIKHTRQSDDNCSYNQGHCYTSWQNQSHHGTYVHYR